jgi:dsDNA-specific endonuclease/ATPase MutS2
MDRDAHYYAEVRECFAVVRGEFQHFMKEAREELKDARESANRANERLYQLSNLSGSYMENQAKANEQGWSAFKGGMEMMIQSVQGQGMHMQQLHAVQSEAMQHRQPVEPVILALLAHLEF